MSWNYRMIRYANGEYGLHEVYYTKKGKPKSMTEEPCHFVGETPQELLNSLRVALVDAWCEDPLDEKVFGG